MKRIRIGLLVLIVGSFLPRLTLAGCKSDCLDDYESARDDCMTTYDSPDDADDLQMCLANAKSEYEACIDECDS